MNIQNICVLTVIGTLSAILSNHKAVCDVDRNDASSILMEQLKVQQDQLSTNREILTSELQQLRVHQEQLKLLNILSENQHGESAIITIFTSISCTALGFIVLLLLQRVMKNLCIRYNISPEMPQTPHELIDFTQTAQRFRSVEPKSPTDYFSCESDE